MNQDSNYKQSICKVIDFKLVSMSKLVRELSALEEDYLKDPLTTGLHVAAREGRTKTVAALLSFGADADAKDKNGKGVYDHTKEIKDEEKRAAVLALMAEYSVLCAVATGKADLVAAAVAKGCDHCNETVKK